MTGQTLTHYAILGKLGEGGMGVVYKARDLTLNRLVALKVLSPDRLASGERQRRFLQEAQAASALNHPHIVTIHEFASDQGCDFLVMEYIEGKTLDRLIPKHGLPLNEALDYAVQVADALTRAHAAGIVHRDLKPGNVIVDKDGQVKVLDFGLARLVAQASACEDQASACETVTAAAKTGEGTIVGTASYMSPEQAEGKPVDARSDIFSFGAVLYEMLTGRRAFQGDSGMSTLAAIIKQEPEPLPAETPHDLGKIIARCLRKDPAWRFQHMDDLRVALAELKMESDSGKLASAQPPAKRRRSRRWAAVAAVCVIVAGLAGAWLTRRATRQASTPEPKIVPLTTYSGFETQPTFSPDGNQVAFVWDGEKGDNLDIYVKLVSGGPPLRLTTSPERDATPAWSPDGRWIAFVRSGPQPALHLVSPLGGLERKLTRASAQRLAWTPDSRQIVCVDRESDGDPFSLWLVSAQTGERTRLTAPAAGTQGDTMPAISPDGRNVAFNRKPVPMGVGEVWMVPLAGGEPHRLFQDALDPVNLVWTPDGREIVYSAELAGSPAGSPSSRLRRMEVTDKEARPRPVAGTGDGATQPAISRPARGGEMRLAFTRIQSDYNLWRLDIPPAGRAPARPSPLSHSTARDHQPSVSPDGSRVVFTSARSGNDELWLAQSDWANPIQLTNFGESTAVGSPRWSLDGKMIVCDMLAGGNRDLYLVNPDGGAPRRLTSEPTSEARPSFSRDGKWIYFGSNRTGAMEIWKLPSTGGPVVQVTSKGGSEPLESWDGKLVYYMKSVSEGGLWSVPAAGGEEKEVLAGVRRGHWCVTAAGIFFVDGSAPGTGRPIRALDPQSRKITTIHIIDKPVPPAGFRILSASADGRSLVFVQIDHSSADLMLVENFR